jgi:F420-0:gamma-glutamyl ligase-like protein
MVIVRFPDEATQKQALGFLIGRFSGHSWATGEMAIPEEALVSLALEGLTFTVEGRATYERILSLRNNPAATV